ncbi:MAG: TetR/AcrR family transcriptional regulator [Panacagrimonas sp.]
MRYKRSSLMEERLAGNRERILLSARKLVAEGGFRAAQIAAVAADAGLSTGSIYRYFPSKAELFVEVLGQAVRHEIHILRFVIRSEGSASDRLLRAVESFARRAFEAPFLAYAFIAEPADQDVDAERIRARREIGNVFRTVLREGIATGEFPDQDADVAAACIVGAFTEALIGPIGAARKGEKQRERVIQTIGQFCLRAVCVSATAPTAKTGRVRRKV